MDSFGLRITFPEVGLVPELEVRAPGSSALPARIETMLASMGIRPESKYLVETPLGLIVHAKLTQADGSPLGADRASELLHRLSQELDREGRPAAPGKRTASLPPLVHAQTGAESSDRSIAAAPSSRVPPRIPTWIPTKYPSMAQLAS